MNRSQNTLTSLDKALDKYIDLEYVTRGLKNEKNKNEEREALNLAINNAINEIAKLTDEEKGNLQLEQDKIEETSWLL